MAKISRPAKPMQQLLGKSLPLLFVLCGRLRNKRSILDALMGGGRLKVGHSSYLAILVA